MSDNKNSFRDMILIIFVVLVCFGITIYGIAYLTSKVFSESGEVEISENERPKEVSTNPKDGDTITFTSMQEEGAEVAPDMDNIITTITPPVKNNVEIADNMVVQEDANMQAEKKVEEKAPVTNNQPKIEAKKEEPVKQVAEKKAEPKKEEVKKAEPKREEVKKVAEPKKAEPKKVETVKPVTPKPVGEFVVQIAAVQSKESAEKEMAKYRAKFPDVFIKQVQINGKTWYRVRLGVSDTRQQAEQVAQRVSQEFKIKPIVTKNN